MATYNSETTRPKFTDHLQEYLDHDPNDVLDRSAAVFTFAIDQFMKTRTVNGNMLSNGDEKLFSILQDVEDLIKENMLNLTTLTDSQRLALGEGKPSQLKDMYEKYREHVEQHESISSGNFYAEKTLTNSGTSYSIKNKSGRVGVATVPITSEENKLNRISTSIGLVKAAICLLLDNEAKFKEELKARYKKYEDIIENVPNDEDDKPIPYYFIPEDLLEGDQADNERVVQVQTVGSADFAPTNCPYLVNPSQPPPPQSYYNSAHPSLQFNANSVYRFPPVPPPRPSYYNSAHYSLPFNTNSVSSLPPGPLPPRHGTPPPPLPSYMPPPLYDFEYPPSPPMPYHNKLPKSPNQEMFKTRYCEEWAVTGSCGNDQCTFAHGERELLRKPFDKMHSYKQYVCKYVESGRICRRGPNCYFLHGSVAASDYKQ
ncbi:hypothetical protein ABFS83_01G006600 [Erythranthe nasuta]